MMEIPSGFSRHAFSGRRTIRGQPPADEARILPGTDAGQFGDQSKESNLPTKGNCGP